MNINFTRKSTNNESGNKMQVLISQGLKCMLCYAFLWGSLSGFLLVFASTPSSNSSSEQVANASLQVVKPEISLAAIAQIESSGRSNAVGDGGRALGLYQLHADVIKEYNQAHKTRIKHVSALNPSVATRVSRWYLEKRIPALLKHFKQPDTLENRLTAYNMGILRVVQGKKAHAYIAKYRRITNV